MSRSVVLPSAKRVARPWPWLDGATITRLASSLVAASANARAGEPCVTSTFSPGSAVRGKGDLSEESVAAIEFLTQEPMSDRVK